MYVGFDYGTSNCAISHSNDYTATLIAQNGGAPYVPSTLYTLDRSLLPEAVANVISVPELKMKYHQDRQKALGIASNTRRYLDLSADEESWFVGDEAINNYISFPGEGWFVKSPKSFLGATGLNQEQLRFFEDVVTLMMHHVKNNAEKTSKNTFEKVVLGRPINFQGRGGEESNRQAVEILKTSAKRVGFKEVNFFYEPLAAGIDYEGRMDKENIVLVLDVGGGTTDCSMIRMGPSLKDKTERADDFLGHSGVRVGGNDFDIAINFYEIMPLLGRNSLLKNGLPTPNYHFSNASKINDIVAQTDFNSEESGRKLEQLARDSQEPQKIALLQKVQKQKLSYQLSRYAEECKIALSSVEQFRSELPYLDEKLELNVNQTAFEAAVESELNTLIKLIDEAVAQAQCSPDLIYITGGTAKSPLIRERLRSHLGHLPIVDGDYFGSVAAGLAKWAEKIYR